MTFTCLSVKLQKHRDIGPYCLKHLYFHEKNDRNMTMNHSVIKNNKHRIVNVTLSSIIRNKYGAQGAKKIIFTACHSGKLKLALTSPDVISTSPKSFLTSRINFTVLLLFKFLKKHHLPIGQVKNRIH